MNLFVRQGEEIFLVAKVFASNSYPTGLHFAFTYTYAVMKHYRLVWQLCVQK